MRATAKMFISALVFNVALFMLFAVLVATVGDAGAQGASWAMFAVVPGICWVMSVAVVMASAIASVLDRGIVDR